jgi:hypothetical protein
VTGGVRAVALALTGTLPATGAGHERRPKPCSIVTLIADRNTDRAPAELAIIRTEE